MSPRRQSTPRSRDPRQRGLQAFESGRFDDAITFWSALHASDHTIGAVLAEAYFRRALTQDRDDEQVNDLRHAIELHPHESRYQYHLGLTFHRLGDLDGAISCYEMVIGQGGISGVGLVLALARLEQDPDVNLVALAGDDANVLTVLAPVQALLRGVAPTTDGDTPIDRLWQGLALIPNGDGSARDRLMDNGALPSVLALNVRRYYLGVAAAQAGDIDSALESWQYVRHHHMDTTWLRNNLTVAILQQFSRDDGVDVDRMAQLAHDAVMLAAGNTALAEPLVQVLDRGARAAATRQDWIRATVLWQDAREVVRANSVLGSPRPLLHNLALAYEAQEQWTEAAEMWRAMLRTRTRKGGDGGQLDDAHWAWIRKRVTECYKRAGTPGEAVTIFRQALKATPDDLDVRLQLVDALIANDQLQAALNEVERLLAIDPFHIDARSRGSALLAMREEFQHARAMLKPILDQQPQHEAVRRQMVLLLLAEGQRSLQWYDLATAERVFQEAHSFAPTDWQPLLNLARVALTQKNIARARELLGRVLDLASDQPDAYLEVIDCWLSADQFDDLRTTLARAEASMPLTADFLIQVGIMLLEQDRPVSPFSFFVSRPQKRKAKSDPRARLATELLDRATAAQPENGHLRLTIAVQLLQIEPALALHYAEEGVRLVPNDPEALMLLASLQIVNQRVRDAKETLRRGTRLARQQGNTILAAEMDELRRHAGDPMLPTMLQLNSFMDMDDIDDIW